METEIVNRDAYEHSVTRFREARVALPTFAELAEPARIPDAIVRELADVDPDAPDARNLYRVHWHNAADRRGRVAVPEHVVLPASLTGVRAPIVVALGNRFPLIRAHKVLAAYACLAPRIVTGQFDLTRHKAVWPSTGNYCRGGVAISRILGCRGVAVLPAGMSEERFAWLSRWVSDPADIIRTPGTESNVKEIYDTCAALEKDPENVIFNQFCEFGNYLMHAVCTGRALGRIFEHARTAHPDWNLAAFVSATGSAGTLAAGDHLKDAYGARIVAVEALECPTMLYNGFGEHNIQGIGDKHIPYIHNVTNTDIATAISDHSTDSLLVLFNTEVGRQHLIQDRGVPAGIVAALENFGLSSICNVLAAIKTAKTLELGPNDAIVTVATDGAALYGSELPKAMARHFGGTFDRAAAGRAFDAHLAGVSAEHLLVLSPMDRNRIFNLGYFTWVEQQGVPVEEFERRRSQDFWRGLRPLVDRWDQMITELNARTGAARA